MIHSYDIFCFRVFERKHELLLLGICRGFIFILSIVRDVLRINRFSQTFLENFSKSLFSFFVFNLLFRLVGFIQPSWSYFTFWLHHFVFFQLDNDYYLETFQELVCDRFDSRKKADECASKAIVFPFPILKSIACDVLTKF